MGASAPQPADIYRQYAPYIWRTLWRLGVPERSCADALHDVFEVVIRRWAWYEDRGHLTAWLAVITHHIAYKHLEAEHRAPLVDGNKEHENIMDGADLDPLSQVASSLSMEDRTAARDLVVRALQALDPHERIVLIMHDLDEHEVPVIARSLGLAQGTVATRLRRGRLKFKAALQRVTVRESRGEANPAAVVAMLSPAMLFQVESEIPPMPEEVFERVWKRLQRSLALEQREESPPGPRSGRGRSDASLGALQPHAKLQLAHNLLHHVLPYVLGVATPLLWNHLHPPGPPIVTTRDQPTVAVLPSTKTDASVAASPSAPESPPMPIVAAPSASARAVAGGTATELEAERLLMSQATGALASGNVAAALVAVQAHAKRYHDGGLLAEEREGIWIAALLRARRSAEAKERFRRFDRLFRNSAQFEKLRDAVNL